MLNAVIRFSLRHRLTVIMAAALLICYGLWAAGKLQVDVFPNLGRPTVVVLTEAQGLAPDEVETLVTAPIEASLNGTPGVTRLRSTSGIGLSICYVEFDWDTDIYRNRQLVGERLQLAQSRLPRGLQPVIGPITSIMGEIQFIGLQAKDQSVSPMDLRSMADWNLRPRLMAVPGVSQVVVMGGDVKQYQILVSTDKLQKKAVSLEELRRSLSSISENTTGGFLDLEGREYLIRPLARVHSVEDIENSLIGLHFGKPVLVKDVATVKIASKVKRGLASINASPAVILAIQKQPQASTLDLTLAIDKEVEQIRRTVSDKVEIQNDLFKQAHFIRAAIGNVQAALRDGIIIVAVVVFIFLVNIRTTAITLIVIPVSLLVTACVFYLLGIGVNTMTLGGLAIAIGELVDDAIVDVENVVRRLRENRQLSHPRNTLLVIYEASSEVRNSIVFSTIIVVLVFAPLFALGGIEGRLFIPLGVAYVVSILASLGVSLTLTPVLCALFLRSSTTTTIQPEGLVARRIKQLGQSILNLVLPHPYLVIGFMTILMVISLGIIPKMGRNFLPKFNESTATIGIAASPGISLAASDAKGREAEKIILSVPEVKSTVRRTGRAEMDEHAEGINWSEIDVDFHQTGRSRPVVLEEIRKRLESIPDVYVNIGQPISHRLDHILSGVRAELALKVFGPDLAELRRLGGEIQDAISGVKGLVDLQPEPLALIPQLKVAVDRERSNLYAIKAGALAGDLELALRGETASTLLEDQRAYDIYMRLDDTSRSSPEKIGSTLVKFMPSGEPVRLANVADIYKGTGPNMINRENMYRRIVISANTEHRDIGSVADDVLSAIENAVTMPTGYYMKLDGQFANHLDASRRIKVLATLALIAIFLVLYFHFHSIILALQVMLNIPLAFIGSMMAIYLTDRTISIATLIALVTLCGIASRNGIMMITHYLHLIVEEKMEFSRDLVIRGTQERLIPVLMTASTATLALLPLITSKDAPGKEILYPVAVVIIGGLTTSTLLDLVVTPTIFFKFGRRGVAAYLKHRMEKEEELLT